MQKSEIESKLVVFEFYEYALQDLKDGITVDEMSHVLSCFKEEENYLACAGIKEAIDSYKQLNKHYEE